MGFVFIHEFNKTLIFFLSAKAFGTSPKDKPLQ